MNKNKDVDSVVVRLAGDSGDGIQLMGSQFAVSTALAGADFATFPDYPAEIRAPAGTTFGVSAYQINLGRDPITTAGDDPDRVSIGWEQHEYAQKILSGDVVAVAVSVAKESEIFFNLSFAL